MIQNILTNFQHLFTPALLKYACHKSRHLVLPVATTATLVACQAAPVVVEHNVGVSQPSGATQEDEVVDIVSDENQLFQLQLLDRTDPQPANIWNGMAPVDNGFAFTTMVSKQLTIRFMDFDLQEQSETIVLTSDEDIEEDDHITDHALLRVEDSFYIVFGTNNLDDLYLMQLDLDGNRQQLIIVQDDGDDPTQDPHIVSDGERICVRWGSDGFNKRVVCYSLDLQEKLLDKLVTTPVPTPKLGSTLWHNDEFWSITGEASQRNLVYTRFDEEWNPLEPFENIIILSENEQWHWFSSGSTYIAEHDIWIIAYTHMEADQQADIDARGRLDVFSGDFQLLDRHEYGAGATYRPHVLYHNDLVFLSYDHGPVSIHKYELVEP